MKRGLDNNLFSCIINSMNPLKRKFLLIIFGPTGVGKTDFALQIAHKMPAEVINMDIGQFYTPLSIGTAKPDWQHSTIPHHMFDIINAPRNYTAIEYRTALLSVAENIWQRRKIPIAVGGSAFYLKSIFFPPRVQTLDIDIDFLYPTEEDLWQKLYHIDPKRAMCIDPHDTYRIKRALEIWHKTGKLPSSFIPQYQPPADFLLLFLTRDRQELNRRINKRVLHMIEQGWLDEIRELIGTPWESFILEKKLIGYNELVDYLAHQESRNRDRVIGVIKKRTRQYAKRQHTFWRMLKREIFKAQQKELSAIGCLEEVNLTFIDLHLYINELLVRLSMIINK